MNEKGPAIFFWWIDNDGDPPSSVDRFPGPACYKFIVVKDTQDRSHVVCSDTSFDEHSELYNAVCRHHPDWLPAGGGFGGDHFPGASQRFGAPPTEVVAFIGSQEHGDIQPLRAPEWASEALALLAGEDSTLHDALTTTSHEALCEDLINRIHTLASPFLDMQREDYGRIRLEWYNSSWKPHEAVFDSTELRPLLEQLLA